MLGFSEQAHRWVKKLIQKVKRGYAKLSIVQRNDAKKMNTNQHNSAIPQVKICGLTRIDEALQCALLGANAIGCVFYPKSPRNLSQQQAKEICLALPPAVTTVGVFVNETFSRIMHTVKYCGLKAVQLHGQESPELVNRLYQENIMVIKALFAESTPSLQEASHYNASAYLVECGQGKLPGGNAMPWDWEKASIIGRKYPLILAGGLGPENVGQAIAAGAPDAVDVSSGVEASPGQKDLGKVAEFMKAVARGGVDKNLTRIF